MLAKVARDGSRPKTTGELFSLYVDRTWREHRKQAGPLAHASEDEVLTALGALFAALIVGGYDALTLGPGATLIPSDLPLGECKALPGVAGLSDGTIQGFLDSRLVLGAGKIATHISIAVSASISGHGGSRGKRKRMSCASVYWERSGATIACRAACVVYGAGWRSMRS